MNENLCMQCGVEELRHNTGATHPFTPNPLRVKIQALEARLEKAEGLIDQIYKHINWSMPVERMSSERERNWSKEAQAFLAEAK